MAIHQLGRIPRPKPSRAHLREPVQKLAHGTVLVEPDPHLYAQRSLPRFHGRHHPHLAFLSHHLGAAVSDAATDGRIILRMSGIAGTRRGRARRLKRKPTTGGVEPNNPNDRGVVRTLNYALHARRSAGSINRKPPQEKREQKYRVSLCT